MLSLLGNFNDVFISYRLDEADFITQTYLNVSWGSNLNMSWQLENIGQMYILFA